MLPMDTSMGRVWVIRGCIISPRHEKGILTSRKFGTNRSRAAYVTSVSRGSCIFLNRDSVGEQAQHHSFLATCQRNAAGRLVRACLVDIKTLMYQHMSNEAYSGKMKAIGKYPACMDVVKCGVLHRKKHEVGYATDSRAIMLRCQHQKNTSSGSQVLFRVVATTMAAKFAVVRAGRYYEAGVGSYTTLMVA